MSTEAQSIEIKSTEVVQLILQFLQENNLNRSFETLQNQSKVSLNQLNHGQLVSNIHQKNWTSLLKQLSQLMLPEELFFRAYEFVIDGLLENEQTHSAIKFLLEETVKPNLKDYQQYRERIMRIEYVLAHPSEINLYKKPLSAERQQALVQQLLSLSTEAEPSRLLALLSQSLKYQINEGLLKPSISLNLFTNQQQESSKKIEPQTIIKQVEKTLQYSEESKITALQLSWNEEYLAIGGIDGLIELYDTNTYELSSNQYQNEGQMFFHDFPITALQFSYSDQMLASVDSNGLVNVWNLENGKLLRKIDKQSRVNALCWGADPSHLLLGYSEKIKLYGIRSCNLLKEFLISGSGSSDYINSLYVSASNSSQINSRLYCVTSAGTLTIFNYVTREQLFSVEIKLPLVSTFRIFQESSMTAHLFESLILGFEKYLMEVDENGTSIRNYPVMDGQLENSIAKGHYIYMCVKGTDGKFRLSVIERSNSHSSKSAKTVFYIGLESGFESMLISRRRNLMITYDHKNRLSFWRPG